MNTPTYESNLSVSQNNQQSKLQSKKYGDEKISTVGTITQKLIRIVDGILMPKNKNKKFERNSSGMNHSEVILAIIDIHRHLLLTRPVN